MSGMLTSLLDGAKQKVQGQFEVVGGLYLKNIITSAVLNGGNIMTGYRPSEWGGGLLGTIQSVFIRSNIGGFFFDAVMTENTESSLTVTSHPTQLGANISDHAFLNPTRITMEIMMSDAMASFIPGMYGDGLWMTKSTNAYKTLLEMQKLRLPLRVVTRRATYNNMLIESISLTDDATTRYALKATVQLVEIFVVNVGDTKVSARNWVTGAKTNKGEAQGVEEPSSTLRKLEDALRGNK